jgi:hypothetical protein
VVVNQQKITIKNNNKLKTKTMGLNKEQILSIIRQALTATGAILITAGVMKEGMTTEILGTIMTLISAVWSIVDKTDANIVKKFDNIQAKQKK